MSMSNIQLGSLLPRLQTLENGGLQMCWRLQLLGLRPLELSLMLSEGSQCALARLQSSDGGGRQWSMHVTVGLRVWCQLCWSIQI